MIGGALLLLLTLSLRLRTLTFLSISLLGLALLGLTLLGLTLLLREAILLITRRRVRRREVRLSLLRRRVVAIIARCITTENDARVQRALPNSGRAIRWRRLMRWRHAFDPDAAHSRRRPMAVRYIVRR